MTETIEAVTPVGDKILVRPDSPESISKGGIIIPDPAKKAPMIGTVMAAGPGRTSETGILLENPIKAGDRIIYNRFAGCDLRMGEDEPVILMAQDDVMAILGPERPRCVTCGH